MLTFAAYDRHVEQLLDTLKVLTRALGQAGIEYRVVGGMAAYLHVSRTDPIAARLTRDIDVAVDRRDLAHIVEALRPLGYTHRRAAGVDMLVRTGAPKARSAIHLVFIREKVRPDYVESVPDFSSDAVPSEEGALLAPVSDLVRMKLTSFRLKDQVHIKDLDEAGLITEAEETGLSDTLRERLRQVRESE